MEISGAGATTYYFPPDSVLVPLTGDGGSSVCEWKGLAEALSSQDGTGLGWRYIRMFKAFELLYKWVAFYPTQMDCFVGDEKARPQPGGYYGGWVTDDIAGPIKGEPGSEDW